MQNECSPRLLVSSIELDPSVTPYLQKLLAKRPEVYRHSVNVAYLAAEICCTTLRNDLKQYLSFDITDKDTIEIVKGALLHDIGKLVIPNKILNKSETLTPEEVSIIMTHSQKGYEMLSNDKDNKYSKTVLDIVKHHHEKLDGKGYPDHIKKIRASTQLVAFCDMYDALTETRAYRAKKSIFSAYKIINEEQLDNDLFLLLASCFDR